jgi:hypothetical protein
LFHGIIYRQGRQGRQENLQKSSLQAEQRGAKATTRRFSLAALAVKPDF